MKWSNLGVEADIASGNAKPGRCLHTSPVPRRTQLGMRSGAYILGHSRGVTNTGLSQK